MPEKRTGKLELDSLKSAWIFNNKRHLRIIQILEAEKSVRVIRFTNRRQVQNILSRLTAMNEMRTFK